MCHFTYRGVRAEEEGSVGEAAWETWWSGSDFSCCLSDNYKEKEDSDTCKHETVSKLPRQRCVCVCALVAMHEYVHTAAACIGAEEEGVADIAGRRIQFPLSSIPVCLV